MTRRIHHPTADELAEMRAAGTPMAALGDGPSDYDLFTQAVLATRARAIAGMCRGSDSVESQHASIDVLQKLTWVKRAILTAIATDGALTDGELENRSEFAACGPSTVRKRRNELMQAGKLVKVGRRERMSLWDIAP